MPVPLTTDQFEELVNKSGLIDPQRLQAYLQRCCASGTLPGPKCLEPASA
jgi:hypothetical protein